MNEKRIVGLDLVRVVAIVLVISLHFILHSNYYAIPLRGIGMFLLTMYEWLVLPCIGLFLMLSGYFSYKVKINKDYFYKIFKIIISYLLISIIAIIFRCVYLNEDISFFTGIMKILNFEADGYAWYVEMYIGLFLLMPFLNMIYDELKTRNKRKILILVLVLITSLPPTFRFFVPSNFGYDFLPNHWLLLYPFTFYFIGKYLKDYPLKLKLRFKLLILFIVLLVQSSLCYFNNYGELYPGVWFGFNDCGHFNLFTLIVTVMIFEIFAHVDIKNKYSKKIISIISLVTFEMYLVSWIADNVFYNWLRLPFDQTTDYLKNYFVYVGLVFISSFLFAYLINKISKFLYIKLKPVYNFVINKFQHLFIRRIFK